MLRFRLHLDRLRADRFARASGVLVGGSAFAQLLTALSLPVLARLYEPADFSMLAVVTGLMAMLSVAACLRFDLAISLPEQDKDAANLLAIALSLATSVSFGLALAVIVAPMEIASVLGQPMIAPYLWLVPLGVLLIAAYASLQAWAVRNRHFRQIASTKIGQVVAGSGTQIALGWLGFGPMGLLLGQILNTGAGSFGLVWHCLLNERGALAAVSLARMRAMFRAYDRFPKFSTWEALFNAAGMHVPMLLIAALAIGPDAGHLVLAMTAMQAPMALIGTAVGQVYLSEAPQKHRDGQLAELTANVIGRLLKVGVGPLIFAGIVAPEAFSIMFGDEWRRAGELVRWMTPWFVMQFLAVPVSMAVHVAGKQKAAMALQLSGLLIRTGMVLATAGLAVALIAEAYAVSGFAFYSLYFAVVMRVVDIRVNALFSYIGRCLPLLLAWVSFGALVALSLAWFPAGWRL